MIKILLYRGTGFRSAVIRWFTRGDYAHAALVLNQWVYEAKENVGVRRRPLKSSDLDDADWYSPRDFHESRFAQLQLFLDDQLNKPYDWPMVRAFFTRATQESRKSKGKWFCSELVVAAMDKVGYPLFSGIPAYKISPGMLPLSLGLELDNATKYGPVQESVFVKWDSPRTRNDCEQSSI